MVPRNALELLFKAGWDLAGSVAYLCLEATLFNFRGETTRRDNAVEAASELAKGLGRCGSNAISVQALLLGRTTRQAALC